MIENEALVHLIERLGEDEEADPAMPWDRTWAILVYGANVHNERWTHRLFDRWRLWTRIGQLCESPTTCAWDGVRLVGSPTRLYHDLNCRKRAHYANKNGDKSPMDLLRESVKSQLVLIEQDMVRAERWTTSQIKKGLSPRTPDLTRHVTLGLPEGRCGAGCQRPRGCTWTRQGPCLFSGTRGTGSESPPPPRS